MTRPSGFATLFVLSLGLTVIQPTRAAAVVVEQYHVQDFAFKAEVPGNPFDVDLVGDFRGPGGARLLIPGFYDGDRTWKIRFAPTLVGQWSLRTVSSVAALNGRSDTVTATGNTNPLVHGRLMVDPVHPHHFVYEDGTRYFLMGYEADWLALVGMNDPERKAMHRLIDQIAARGFNHVLVNVYAHDTTWAKGTTCEWDYGPPAMYVFGGLNETPDHSRLNTDYFKKFDEMMRALQDKGLIANIMIKVYNKLVNWPASGSKDEERYFRYVTARYQAFTNVTWDFSKEQFYEKDRNLQHHLIDLIRDTDAYDNLTTTHTMDGYFWDPKLSHNLDFATDQEHSRWMEKVLLDRAVHDWPYVNSELYYEKGVEDLPTYRIQHDWQTMVRGAYEVYLSGGYYAYYYSNTAWDVVKPDPEPPGMSRMQILKENLSALPYWLMEPKPELAVGSPALAMPGYIYAFYVAAPTPPTGSVPATRAAKPPTAKPTSAGGGASRRGEITVNLTGLPAGATLQWVNTWSGEKTEEKIGGPGVYLLDRPVSFGAAPALLIVRADH